MSSIASEELGKIEIPFGQYKGKTIRWVYKVDPEYLVWARDEWEGRMQVHITNFLKEMNRQILRGQAG